MRRSEEHAYEALIQESEQILRSAGVIRQESTATQAEQGRQELASLKAAEAESAVCG